MGNHSTFSLHARCLDFFDPLQLFTACENTVSLINYDQHCSLLYSKLEKSGKCLSKDTTSKLNVFFGHNLLYCWMTIRKAVHTNIPMSSAWLDAGIEPSSTALKAKFRIIPEASRACRGLKGQSENPVWEARGGKRRISSNKILTAREGGLRLDPHPSKVPDLIIWSV